MQSSGPDPSTTDGKTGGDGDAVLTLNVKSSTGGKFTVEVESLEENVSVLKQRLEKPSGFPADTMRLIYKGRVLKDDERMQELCDKHGLESGHTMHLVRGARPAAGAGASTGAATAPAGAPPPPPPTPASGAADSGGGAPAGVGATSFDMFVPPGTGGGAAAGLGMLGGIGAAAGGGGGGGDAAAPSFQQQLQQQLLANPGAMQELLNSPLMDSMAENPELMRSLMMANPQVRDLVNQNPEIAHLLSDPTVLRQTMQMMRNPRLMQEMMRNNDRAMANLEAMPGGFDALRRMYSDLQVPLENVATATQQQQQHQQQTQLPLLGATNPAAPGTGTNSAQQQQPPSSNIFGAAAAAGQTPADGSRGPFGAISQDAVLQAMRSIVDNPELLHMVQEQIVSSDAYMWSNPMVAAMAAQNPQMQRALQDPEFRRRLFSADFFRAALALQEAQLRFHHLILTALREGGYEGAASAPYAAPPPFMFPNPGDRPGGAAAASPPPPDPTVSMTREQLEQHFATQLQQLREMGFYDTDACITALRATGGNVSAALDRLLNSSF
ncbi:hypothetical protein CDCA_CDCA03G1087 [Cyanidium caldarium]|uniref:Ubiquilin n=1 Tax=Cyanidium caldarium TaxID=2771 RepID=A0AAV9IRT8_CYACA|nr:hypothetical protein CDCA_CDCA03G1087 [Cyanidium caldarium]